MTRRVPRVRRRPRLLVAALVTSAAVALAAPAQPPASPTGPLPELRPLPQPPLEAMSPAVRERLDLLRSSLASDLAAPTVDRDRLTAGFARLGQLYLLYQLDQAARDCFWNAARLDPADARWDYYLGVALERLGQHGEAAESYERVLASRPGDEATLVRLGRLALEAGDLPAAGRWFRQALEHVPASAAAHQGLGQLAAFREDWAAAAEHLARALDLQPGASALHYELGLAYRGMGEMERAREQMAQRGSVHTSFPDPLIDGLRTLAPGVRHHIRRGSEAAERGDLAAAEAAYRQAIEADPEHAASHEALGAVLALQGRLSEALATYRRVLEREPDDAHAHHAIARVLLRAGRTEEALRHLRRAVELIEDFPAAHHDRAVALERLGRRDEAAVAAHRVVELRPDDTEARLVHARLRLLAAVDPWQDPESELRRLIGAGPDRGMAWLTLGSLAASQGDREGALDAYQRVLSLEGSDPETRALRSRAHLLIARLDAAGGEPPDDEALDHLRAAAGLTPDLAEAHAALAGALLRRGETAEAIREYRSALGLDPRHGEAVTGLARALLAVGRCVEAREHLERSRGTAPGDPGIRELLARVRESCPG